MPGNPAAQGAEEPLGCSRLVPWNVVSAWLVIAGFQFQGSFPSPGRVSIVVQMDTTEQQAHLPKTEHRKWFISSAAFRLFQTVFFFSLCFFVCREFQEANYM